MRKLPLLVVPVVLGSCSIYAQAPAPAPNGRSSEYWPPGDLFPGRGRISSWKDFRAHDERLRARFAAHRADDQDALVFVGDSITEGWHSLKRDFADLGVKVVNRGIGGDTTPNLLYRLEDDVLSLHPRGLVILIGTNDLGEHTAPVDIAANLRVIISRIRIACPDIPVAWCLVMPRGDGADYPAQIRELNALIGQLVKSDRNITVCDTFTPLAAPNGTEIPKDYHPDQLHPNEAGYDVWRAALHPVLARWNLGGR